MQNIPSHASDIRHLFRATPSMKLNVPCNVSDDIISVSMKRFNSVYTSSNELKYVDEVIIGEYVKILYSNKEVFLQVEDVSINELTTTCNLILKNDGIIRNEDVCDIPVQTSAYVIISSDYSLQKSWL